MHATTCPGRHLRVHISIVTTNVLLQRSPVASRRNPVTHLTLRALIINFYLGHPQRPPEDLPSGTLLLVERAYVSAYTQVPCVLL